MIAAITSLYAANYYIAHSYSGMDLSEALWAVERRAKSFSPLSPRVLQREVQLTVDTNVSTIGTGPMISSAAPPDPTPTTTPGTPRWPNSTSGEAIQEPPSRPIERRP